MALCAPMLCGKYTIFPMLPQFLSLGTAGRKIFPGAFLPLRRPVSGADSRFAARAAGLRGRPVWRAFSGANSMRQRGLALRR